jgi:hypothetical protein
VLDSKAARGRTRAASWRAIELALTGQPQNTTPQRFCQDAFPHHLADIAEQAAAKAQRAAYLAEVAAAAGDLRARDRWEQHRERHLAILREVSR